MIGNITLHFDEFMIIGTPILGGGVKSSNLQFSPSKSISIILEAVIPLDFITLDNLGERCCSGHPAAMGCHLRCCPPVPSSPQNHQVDPSREAGRQQDVKLMMLHFSSTQFD